MLPSSVRASPTRSARRRGLRPTRSGPVRLRRPVRAVRLDSGRRRPLRRRDHDHDRRGGCAAVRLGARRPRRPRRLRRFAGSGVPSPGRVSTKAWGAMPSVLTGVSTISPFCAAARSPRPGRRSSPPRPSWRGSPRWPASLDHHVRRVQHEARAARGLHAVHDLHAARGSHAARGLRRVHRLPIRASARRRHRAHPGGRGPCASPPVPSGLSAERSPRRPPRPPRPPRSPRSPPRSPRSPRPSRSRFGISPVAGADGVSGRAATVGAGSAPAKMLFTQAKKPRPRGRRGRPVRPPAGPPVRLAEASARAAVRPRAPASPAGCP